ncbi:MAG TPA: nitroreductase family protein [Abditibacteriaceae bacterium]|nr:nitroreductase family protein [Abditibacteriaceae bacterium]
MIITIFRSRLREESHIEYSIVAEETERLARAMPGFVSFKTFAAPDGERCSVVEFDSWESHNAWAQHPRHRVAQGLGRSQFYSSFSILVAEEVRRHQFKFEGEKMSDLDALNEQLHEDVKPHRQADHAIDATFLNRWSPRAFSSQPVEEEKLMQILEAARWAASSYNEQPWRFLLARTPQDVAKFLDILVPANQVWAKDAPVLLFVAAKKTFSHNGKPNLTHQYDAGTSSGYMTFQAELVGLIAHGMVGFDGDKARTVLNVPDDFQVMAAYAIGYHGDKSQLPPEVQEREVPSSRRPLQESIFEGGFSAHKEEKAEAETDTPDLT